MHIKFGDEVYDYDLDEQLKSQTGLESAAIEEFLGGWQNFRAQTATTKTTILLIWLGKRASGQTDTLEDVGNTPGLMFGDMIDIGDDDEPEDPMRDPGRPLAETSDAPELNGGSEGSELSLVTSAGSGDQLSEDSTV
jgi:hypothetical protein